MCYFKSLEDGSDGENRGIILNVYNLLPAGVAKYTRPLDFLGRELAKMYHLSQYGTYGTSGQAPVWYIWYTWPGSRMAHMTRPKYGPHGQAARLPHGQAPGPTPTWPGSRPASHTGKGGLPVLLLR